MEREWDGIGVYKGEYVEMGDHKRAHGHGSFHYTNGDVFEGEWRDGQRSGKGDRAFASLEELHTDRLPAT